MKKAIQLVTLIVGILLLCGCEKWSDIEEEYSDILEKNPVCTYTSTTSGVDEYIGFKTITFYGSTSGINVSYDNGAKQTIINSDGYENIHYLDSYTIAYNDFDLSSFLNEYKQANTCPTTIYACQIDFYIYVMNQKSSTYSCVSYKSTKSSDNTGSDGLNCVVESATKCEHQEFTDQSKRKVYFEIGLEKTSSGQESKYFVVSYDRFQTTYDVAKESTNGLALTTTYGDTYLVEDETIFDTVNGKFPTVNVRYNSTGSSMIYYLYNANNSTADNYGDYDAGNTVVTTANSNNNDNVGNTNTDITEVNLCSSDSNALKAFQIVGYLLFILKIVVPLILIIMASIDFAKAVISSNEKPNADILKKLFQRVLVGVIIFLIPTILNFLLSLVDGASATVNDSGFTGCTDCLLDPFGACQAKDIDE